MDLIQLRYFVTVAKLEHVTRAAQQLNVAQPAITYSIKKLEQELQTKLFYKNGRNVSLNSTGAALLEKLEPLLTEIDALPEFVKQFSQSEDSTIRLNVLAATNIITEIIIAYKRQHEDIRFQLYQNVQHENCDITISTQKPEFRATDSLVVDEEIFLAVPQSRFSGVDSIALADVRDEYFISLYGSKALRHICDDYCAKAGFIPKIAFESDSPVAVKNLIGANLGIGFWPEFSWGEPPTQDMKLLKIIKPECKRELVITPTAGDKKPCAEDFIEFLYNFLKEKAASCD